MKNVCFLIALLLCACGCADIGPEPAPPATAAPAQAGIIIPPNSGAHILGAAAALARELSGKWAGLEFAVHESPDPPSALSSGDALLAFTPVGDWSRTAALLSSPFLYESYEHFSMSMNSRTVLGAVGKETAAAKTTPLAVFYTGSAFLLSSINPNNYRSFRSAVISEGGDFTEEYETEEGGEDEDEDVPEESAITPALAMISHNTQRRHAYTAAGSVVTVISDPSARLEKLLDGQLQIAEFSAREGLSPAETHDGIRLTASWQDIRPLWLLADSGWLDSLTGTQERELREAVSKLFHAIDQSYLREDLAVFAQFSGWPFIEPGDFSRTRRLLSRDAINSLALSPGIEQRRILNHIDSIRR
ncbi:MAG: hypothetical protein FWH02_02945 [Oscillospiraceae bacterium]|nr:hypothetical protein [Oscillospiraceae bacterium]